MKTFILAAAALTAANASSAAEPPQAIEKQGSFWQSVRVDGERGVALFATPAHRVGDAILFEMLLVYRDPHKAPDVGMSGITFDKEVYSFLGDCGAGTVLRMDYSFQTGSEPVRATVSPVPMPERPYSGSDLELAFAQVCRASQGKEGWQWPSEYIREPYVWAKERLRQTSP